ncbi:NADP-dependent oxidoreductase [Agreia pratensis]|uniref:NADP-dependent oxidoreductase n=1 Tax=Agreia pratensis TaxID=150121 RepID=UPI002B273E08|nr:NADP-dependent oxidoreductase [Agreia pratensis]
MTPHETNSITPHVVSAPPSSPPALMKAVVFDAPGDPSVLRLTDVATPARVGSEVLVKVSAAGINPIDAKTRSGAGVSVAIPFYPTVIGRDFCGIVVESPYDGHPLKPGDEVYGVSAAPRTFGSYAQYVAVPSLQVARKPRRLTPIEAAAVPTAALTAWGLVVDLAKAHEGQRMLIHSGAGGVGHLAVQLAVYFGARVIATTSGNNASWLRSLGAEEVIDYTTTRFEERVSDVDVVIDLVGNVHDNTGTRSLSVLRHGGLIISVPTGGWPGFAEEAEKAGVRWSGFSVSPDAACLAIISRLIDSGDLHVHVSEIYPLDEASEAHTHLERGHTRGKIVLEVP